MFLALLYVSVFASSYSNLSVLIWMIDTGRTDVLTCPKRDILDSAKQYITSLGADEPPHLSEAFLTKLGFNSRSSRPSSRNGRSGGSGSRGRDNYSRDGDRGRSSSRYNSRDGGRDFSNSRNNDRSYSRNNDRTDRRDYSDRFFSRD